MTSDTSPTREEDQGSRENAITPSEDQVVVFLDETAYPSLEKIDPDYPMFLLALLVCEPDVYIEQIVPAVYRFKYQFFGHEAVILHSYEIRKQRERFSLLRNAAIRGPFLQGISDFMSSCDYDLILCGIHKQRHRDKYREHASDPYELALAFALERLVRLLEDRYPRGAGVTLIAEARGGNEDKDLELHFLRYVTNGTGFVGPSRFAVYPMRLIFVRKEMNVVGLQMADLAAYPAARHALNPSAPNLPYEAIRGKVRSRKIFP